MTARETIPVASADVCDRFGTDARACATELRLYGHRRVFAGPAQTIRCYEDNVLVRQTLSQPGDGRVLVIDGGGSLEVALLGEEIAEIAAAGGWSGVVINGAVRDVAALAEIETGVAALGSNPRRSGKAGTGIVGEPVSLGGVTFAPGDYVCVDEDGVVAVPRAVIEREAVQPPR
jgi:regulator of ribonuclease activity A